MVRRWLATEFGEPPQVLHRRYQQEFIVRALESPESQAIKPEVPLHVGKHHLYFLALPDTGVNVFIAVVDGARPLTGFFINASPDSARRRVRTAAFFQWAAFTVSSASAEYDGVVFRHIRL